VPAVINVSKTKRAGSLIVKAVLDANLVDGHRIFSYSKSSYSMVVAQKVRDAIEHAGCTGTEFSKVPIA
jgi:hypothetical protein